MADNIIDFISSFIEQKGRAPDVAAPDINHLLGFIDQFKCEAESEEYSIRVLHTIAPLMVRVLFIPKIAVSVEKVIKRIGYEPENFYISRLSIHRFLTTDNPFKAEYCGPWFNARIDEYTVLIATEILSLKESGEADLRIKVFRIGDEDETWQEYKGGLWDLNGPPDEYFALLLEDLDDMEDDRPLRELEISDEIYNVLEEAGIETIEELADLKEQTVRMIVGDLEVEEIREALEAYDLRMR